MCVSKLFKTPSINIPQMPTPTVTPPPQPVTTVATDVDPLATIRKKRLGKARFKSGAVGGLPASGDTSVPSSPSLGLPGIGGIRGNQ